MPVGVPAAEVTVAVNVARRSRRWTGSGRHRGSSWCSRRWTVSVKTTTLVLGANVASPPSDTVTGCAPLASVLVVSVA